MIKVAVCYYCPRSTNLQRLKSTPNPSLVHKTQLLGKVGVVSHKFEPITWPCRPHFYFLHALQKLSSSISYLCYNSSVQGETYNSQYKINQCLFSCQNDLYVRPVCDCLPASPSASVHLIARERNLVDGAACNESLQGAVSQPPLPLTVSLVGVSVKRGNSGLSAQVLG